MEERLITVTSIGIAIVSLLIVFNIVGIINTIDNPATGFAISEDSQNLTPTKEIQQTESANSREDTSKKTTKVLDENPEEQTQLYSEQAYGLFYFILIIIIVIIVFIGLTIIVPKIKRYT